jgi:hypothetical protein
LDLFVTRLQRLRMAGWTVLAVFTTDLSEGQGVFQGNCLVQSWVKHGGVHDWRHDMYLHTACTAQHSTAQHSTALMYQKDVTPTVQWHHIPGGAP